MVDVFGRHRKSEIGVVAFASGGKDFRHPIPGFEWKRTLDQLDVGYVLIRDSTERWYQDGVEGIGDRPAVVEFVRQALAPYHRKLTLGLSSGAYGALLFGQLAPVDEVIAISPLTVLGPDAEREFGPKWAHRVRLPPHQAGYSIDLRPFFLPTDDGDPGGPIPHVRAFVSDGEGAELDYRMAELIHAQEIVRIPGYSHADLAKHMVQTRLIHRLIMGEPWPT